MGSPTADIKKHIATMCQIAESVDTTDLVQLAKLHEHATQIEQLSSSAPDDISELLESVCEKVVKASEDIILEDSIDPDLFLKATCTTISQLSNLSLEEKSAEDVALLQELLAVLDDVMLGTAEALGTTVPSAESTEKVEKEEKQAVQVDEQTEELTYVQEPLHIENDEMEFLKSFLAESEEHIESIEGLLLEIEDTPDDLDQLNELFRPFHTIKGMTGFLNLKDINILTHALETMLDLARKGKLLLTSDLIDVIFEAVDVLKVQISMVGEYVANPNGEAIEQPQIETLLHRVHAAAQGKVIARPVDLASPADKKLGQILVEDKKAAPAAVDFALEQQHKPKHAGEPVGEILTSMNVVSDGDVKDALRKQKAAQDTVIRVDTAKLDNLINMVGELVIAQSQVAQQDTADNAARTSALNDQVSKITRDVQEIAMGLRMVPIGATFHKMGRVCRDIARKAEKQIEFLVEGEDTELDKNVIQEISDPLMHMVRNAVDHGVETREERKAAGKSEKGIVKLRAYHLGGNIVIEVTDDGKGLDPEVLLKKGIEKGMVDPDAQLSEQQIYQLVMTAGFSTATKVTDISGRGVGMDVVKRNIENLRGRVDIASEKGKGTTFTIRLPLTLAVIDGMIIRAGDHKYIIPTLSIQQALQPTPEQLTLVQGRGKMLNLRGNLYTLVSLADLFEIPDAAVDPCKGLVVIVQLEEEQIGIILDEIMGQQQVVIKSLGDQFKDVPGISGGAILGDGTIGLIIEPEGLKNLYK